MWSLALFADVSRYFVKLLNSLGYNARLKIVGDDSQSGLDKFFGLVSDSRNKVQMAAWWNQGPPSPSEITVGLRCRSFVPNSGDNENTTGFCSRELDAKIEHALRLQATDPAKAGSAWAAVDRQIVDDAPTIPLLVPQGIDLVSKRVGNYQHNPPTESSSASCGSSEQGPAGIADRRQPNSELRCVRWGRPPRSRDGRSSASRDI